MTYLSENPWPLILLFIVVAAVGFLSGSAKGRGVAAVCVLLAIGLFFLERYLISPAEQVESRVAALLTEFKNKDVEGIGEVLSAESQDLKDIAARGLELVELSDTFRISSVVVEVNDNGDSAIAMVRANGELTPIRHGGGPRHVPTFWKTMWRTENEVWKLHQVIRLNPANGEEMGILSAK